MSNFEQGSGFSAEWSEDKELLEKANKLADFYRSKLQEISLEVSAEEEVLIHFTNDDNLLTINGENPTLLNNSPFYDCDREYLASQGFDISAFEKQFGSPDSLVAIPLKSFENWIGSKSWIKLAQRGSLNNVIVFTIPKKSLILRDHQYIEKAFDRQLAGQTREEIYQDQVQYFNSTVQYGDQELDKQMWEAWIPNQVNPSKYKIISYQE